jgi:hypothetical protein
MTTQTNEFTHNIFYDNSVYRLITRKGSEAFAEQNNTQQAS